MIIKINLIHVAEELAHADVARHFRNRKPEAMYNVINDIEVYQSDVMEFYIKKYDYYFEILTNSENEQGIDHKAAYTTSKQLLIVSGVTKKILEDICIAYPSNISEDVIYQVPNNIFFYITTF